ncbi:hypothetical protein ACIBM4_22110 [Streptomyces sp. NPDC050256]|uniref:hypothetical protein n=1 Tax=unclassified Streptomyces TaxID=2593676 RepID=UPI0037979B64
MQQALDAGHVVTAYARTPGKLRIEHANLSVSRADLAAFLLGQVTDGTYLRGAPAISN